MGIIQRYLGPLGERIIGEIAREMRKFQRGTEGTEATQSKLARTTLWAARGCTSPKGVSVGDDRR
jgi:hypothetical protein